MIPFRTTDMTATLQTAQLLRSSGISTIPCGADKRPRIKSWDEYQKAVPSPEELEQWFRGPNQIALLGGRVQCIDFDDKYSKGIFSRFCARAADCGLDGLIGECIMQQTPSGGMHLVFQCDGAPIRNDKLASKANHETLIETRGDGGYFLIAPSDNYKLLVGDWSSVPSLTEEDRDALLNLARTFDETPPIEAHEPRQTSTPAAPGSEATPGDDFDFLCDMPALLQKHGWRPASRDGKYWTRPGKTKGISASWDVVPDRFFVFSSSTAFEPMHVYRPWHVFAVLECGKDYAGAARELRRLGYGGVAPAKHQQPLPADYMPSIEGVQPGASASHAGAPAAGGGAVSAIEPPTQETEEERIRRLLVARRFDPEAVPPPIRTRFSMLGVTVATPGNLAAVTAQAKVGKSALMQAFVAATMNEAETIDCLGIKGFNAQGHGVIYFDTEQSKDDFWRAIDRAKRRAAVPIPEWFSGYGVGDLPCAMQRKALAIRMADAKAQFGGIHSVIIDGVADLVLDVNDAQECNALVAELFTLAARYDCSVICVIHKNPGSDKTRGHLGSQIERKAETNLTLEKDGETTVVYSIKQRRAPIYKADGLVFAWSETAGMHVVSDGSAKPKMTKALEKWLDFADTVFGRTPSLSFVDLRTALMAEGGAAISTVEKQMAALQAAGYVKKDSFGKYTFKDLRKNTLEP
jgi:Bifunctional DNA primase/polymerase, N-terminal/AAA domain